MLESDWEAVRAIYLEGAETGDATFEAQAPSFKEWNKRHIEECRLVSARVGIRERLGRLNGVWRDVVLIERRSNVVGNNPST